MAIPIEPSNKFACFAFTFYNGVGGDVPAELQLGPRLWVARHLDFDVAKHWREWLGSLRMSALEDANFVMYATMPTATPKVLDGENIDLVKTLDYLLYGMLLQDAPEYQQGFSLTERRRRDRSSSVLQPDGVPSQL